MRIVNDETDEPIRKVWVSMTEVELRELHEHLVVLFEDQPLEKPWHSHVGDDSSTKLSISLE